MVFKNCVVIVRPTEECNLRCYYCYSNKSSKKRFMNIRTLENLIKKVLSFYKEVTFLWHGGEAMLMGIDFFNEILELQRKYGKNKKIINEIQTNGTLINEEWGKFFKENKFYVGVSIDGPKEINDRIRIYKDGSGSFDDILRGINILKKYKVETAGICVLGRHNISKIEDVYNFYKKIGISLNINPFIGSGRGKLFEQMLQITPEEYGYAMIKLFNLWFQDPSVKIFDFYKIIKSFFIGDNNICCFSGRCSKEYISICPNGDVYPCGRWAGYTRFKMGNINTNTMEEIITSKISQKLTQRILKLRECINCKWVEICNGGCPHTSYIYTGSIYGKDFYCRGRKILFEYMYNVVSSYLEKCRSK